jgi:putative endonuclease
VTDQKKYWVYIVASRTGTLYIGITNNLYVRVLQHKSREIEGFSSQYHCDRLVYWESFDEVLKAIDREKQLKGWRRAKKIVLIESMNPRWEDLAEKAGAEMAFAGQLITARRERLALPLVVLTGMGSFDSTLSSASPMTKFRSG